MTATAGKTDGSKRARVLVVDDEPLIRAQIGLVLENLGHDFIEAESGEQALEVVQQDTIDLVLLDLMMEGISGIEVCKQLRANPATRTIRIIVVSGVDTKEALEESIIAGADDFLAKPVNSLELGVRVRSILRVRDIHDDEQRVEAYIRNMQEMRGEPKTP